MHRVLPELCGTFDVGIPVVEPLSPYLIWLFGYLPFFTMAFVVHDMRR
jgi:hypothetical protein